MISKILIWVGCSTTILCVGGVVAFAAIGLIGWAVGCACCAVLLAFMCRIESNALGEWDARRNDAEWKSAYRGDLRL
jgi:hypothetical protein